MPIVMVLKLKENTQRRRRSEKTHLPPFCCEAKLTRKVNARLGQVTDCLVKAFDCQRDVMNAAAWVSV